MYIYRTYFILENPVWDFAEAKKYLQEDDMVQYLHGDHREPKDSCVQKVTWVLTDNESGYIEVESTRELTNEESKNVSDWISGQNSDGLMENFGDFGCYEDAEGFYTNYPYDEYGNEKEFFPSEPDWLTNDYELEFIREE